MQSGAGPVTIRDVARVAGVSVATVSRTLNGSPTVDPELAARVREAVATSGYVRNAAGRALRRQVADIFAAIVPDLNPFYTGVLAAFERTVIESGYSVMLCNSAEDVERERRYVIAASAQQMAGAIVAVTSEDDTEPTEMLAATMPVVLFDREVIGYEGDLVVIDNERTGELVAEHLLAQGSRRPACIAGPADVSTTEGRLRGFRAGLARAGLRLSPERVARASLNAAGGGSAMRSLAALDEPPDAVFATTGPLSVGAYQALQELPDHGDRPALVGHDDDQWTQIVRPQITVIRQPVEEIGASVAEMLLARAHGGGGPGVRRVLTAELVVRQSSLRSDMA